MFNWCNSGVIYVSQTKGSDANNGFFPKTDIYLNGPVQSIDRALTAVEEMRCAGNMRPMTIALLDDYYLNYHVVIKETMHSVTLQSAGERKRLIGGIRLAGWKHDSYNGKPCFSAKLPDKKDGSLWDCSDLIVNGKYAQLTRFPKEGTLRAKRTEKDAKEGDAVPLFYPSKWFEADLEDMAKVPDIRDSIVNFYHYWVDGHTPVEDYDPDTGKVTMKYPSRFGINTRYGSEDGIVPLHTAAFRYYLTNVPSQFGVPGEWFLQRETGTVYYMPTEENSDPEKLEAFVPVADKLLEISAADVRICGLELLCTRGDYVSRRIPSDDGNSCYYSQTDGFASDEQSVCGASGAVVFENALRGGIFGCHLHGLGVHAVEIRPGCRYIRIEENTIDDICAGGIHIWGDAAKKESPAQTSGCVIRGNRITRCGVRYAAGNGILVRHASQIEISDNEISYLNYSGITVGWVWGYADSSTYGNVIRRNHIHHIGYEKKLADLGGIYLLGKQQGTVIAENRIHNIASAVYGAWGIYTDEGSSYITVENNVVYDTQSECFHQHYGSYNVVRNNIFAFGGTGCIKASRDEVHDGVLLENNIILTDGIPFFASRTRLQPITCSKNLYWDMRGEPMFLRRHGDKIYTYSDRLPLVYGDSFDFKDWQEYFGKDIGSVIADPVFADVENRNFLLSETSPAIAMGFRPISGFPAIGIQENT